MKPFLTLFAGLAIATTASAADFYPEGGKAYRIVSCSYPDATICVGEQHWTQPYIFSNQDFKGECRDCWWYFEKQYDGSYAIYNADTKQYITYTQNRLNGVCKGLELTNKDTGAQSHWFFEDMGNGQYLVYTTSEDAVTKGDNYWNQRVNASDNYLLGTYNYATTPNSLFTFTTEGYNPNPGPDPGPGPDPDKPDPTPETDKSYTVLDGGEDFYVVGQTGNRITLIPKGYVDGFDISDHTVTFTLGAEFSSHEEDTPDQIVFSQVNYLDENVFPADVEFPTFTSYKFNNKFNYQVPVDAEATDPTAETMTIPVGGIGKWLTASFQFSHEGAVAYIGDVLQKSKETRQRFDRPMTYTVTFPTWKMLEIRQPADGQPQAGSIYQAYVPFGSEQTVTIDWLCDHPTTEYGVPRIDITLTDHRDAKWGSGGWGGWGWDEPEYYWLGQDGKTTYVNAEIVIDGGGVFPSMEATPILIKGRGNSTWSQSSSSKNPYHFKFESKQKPLGLTKGKHWVLLSNKQSGSMTTNAIGHRVAEMMGGAAPCHIIPVELYINDSYRGSYNLCERVGLAGNSVSFDDDTNAAMIELDTYTDEQIYKDSYYYLSTKMKDPDFDYDYTGPLTPTMVMNDWEQVMEAAFLGDDIASFVDVELTAAYLAANEAICNCELKHAKSCFAFSGDVTDGFSIEAGADVTPWAFGPLWDCDWAFGYEQRKTYFQASQSEDFFGSLISGGDSNGRARNMWNALRNNPEVNKAYYYKWYNFATYRLPEFLDFCDDYYAFASRTLSHNTQNEANERDGQNYQQLTTYAKQWMQKHTESVMNRIKSYPLPVEPVAPDPTYDDPTGPIQGNLGGGGIVGVDCQNADHESDAAYDLQGRRTTEALRGISVTRSRKTLK